MNHKKQVEWYLRKAIVVLIIVATAYSLYVSEPLKMTFRDFIVTTVVLLFVVLSEEIMFRLPIGRIKSGVK